MLRWFFMLFLSSAGFSKINLLKLSFRNTIRVLKGLDPDQDQHCLGHLFAKIISKQQKPPLAGKELNSLDPDQTWKNVRLDRDSNCLHRLSADHVDKGFWSIFNRSKIWPTFKSCSKLLPLLQWLTFLGFQVRFYISLLGYNGWKINCVII